MSLCKWVFWLATSCACKVAQQPRGVNLHVTQDIQSSEWAALFDPSIGISTSGASCMWRRLEFVLDLGAKHFLHNLIRSHCENMTQLPTDTVSVVSFLLLITRFGSDREYLFSCMNASFLRTAISQHLAGESGR